jgi:hypothetical protein
MPVYKRRIKQGTAWIVANNKVHAKQQARALERDLQRYWVRQATEYRPGVFCLGSAAKAHIGIKQAKGVSNG